MAEGAVQQYVANGISKAVDQYRQGGGQPQPEEDAKQQRVINLEAFEENEGGSVPPQTYGQ